MLNHKDMWVLEEDLPLEEPAEVLRAMPEIQKMLDPEPEEEELGLRSVLEHPAALSKAWWQTTHAGDRRRAAKKIKRRAEMLSAA